MNYLDPAEYENYGLEASTPTSWVGAASSLIDGLLPACNSGHFNVYGAHPAGTGTELRPSDVPAAGQRRTRPVAADLGAGALCSSTTGRGYLIVGHR